jgi:4,5-DOPA dioxygenase extradiol
MSLNQTLDQLNAAFPTTGQKLPVLFVGHGSPMNAIEDNEFSRAWAAEGKSLPRPAAILCISAHWGTRGTHVTGMEKPRTIHDFGGFPPELYAAQYPAPGSPDLACLTQQTVQSVPVGIDETWGLDHGTWSVLAHLFPAADVPVVQLSLDLTQPASFHYALGKELSALRRKNVLIVSSGNLVHNLGRVQFVDQAYDWAIEFDETAKKLILSGDHGSLVHYEDLGPAARLSIPTNEHYLPMLYALALQEPDEQVRFFADRVTYASLSMRSLRIE